MVAVTWTSSTLEVMTLRVNYSQGNHCQPVCPLSQATGNGQRSAARAGHRVTEIRIDDLAQRAELTVDTIRYYQREGLLPAGRPGRPDQASTARTTSTGSGPDPRPPGPALLARGDQGAARVGPPRPGRRHLRRRGPAHLLPRRPGRASRRLNADAGRPACAASGCCATRPSSGATPTTTPTSTCCAPSPSSQRLGLPDDVLVELGVDLRRAASSAMQREVLELFSGQTRRPTWDPAELAAFQQHAAAAAGQLLPLVTASSSTCTSARCSASRSARSTRERRAAAA